MHACHLYMFILFFLLCKDNAGNRPGQPQYGEEGGDGIFLDK